MNASHDMSDDELVASISTLTGRAREATAALIGHLVELESRGLHLALCFKSLYGSFAAVAPLRANITIEDVGRSAVYLASDLSSAVTGEVLYVDGGFNVLGVPLAD